VFATRVFHPIDGAPFMLHCDRFIRALTRTDERTVSFSLAGPAGLGAKVSLIAQGTGKQVAARMRDASGAVLVPVKDAPGMLSRFEVPAQGAYTLSW